jgi:hypothetical protein
MDEQEPPGGPAVAWQMRTALAAARAGTAWTSRCSIRHIPLVTSITLLVNRPITAGLAVVGRERLEPRQLHDIGDEAMEWITRSDVRVDRVACPWLIRRFIDRKAEFLFVREADLLNEAQKVGATALTRPGLIVRAADVKDQEHVAPGGPGLRAVATGFAESGATDVERLARQFPMYDALYEYVRPYHSIPHVVDADVRLLAPAVRDREIQAILFRDV